MTSAGIPEDGQYDPPHPLPVLQIPKNRSSVNLLSQSSSSSSLHADNEGFETLARSPILSPERDTGLRRIRQPPASSLPRNASSPSLQPLSPVIPQARSARQSFSHIGPNSESPSIPFSEDLSRFPSESLHSFSFAHQSVDSLYSRQNVLKRSIEFMRDKLAWAATSPRIASAQARLTGDEELLSIMELLQKANMLGSESVGGLNIVTGPLTGPAHMATEGNPFEQSFIPQIPEQDEDLLATPRAGAALGGSSTLLEQVTNAAASTQATVESDSSLSRGLAVMAEPEPLSLANNVASSNATETTAGMAVAQRPKASLKRTYTDVAGLSLQHRLTEAMAQPYHTSQPPSVMSPTNPPVFTQPPLARSSTLNSVERAPHGHRHQQAQAIFMTEASAPWTITAANDLACLVFGVTRAEVRKLGIMEVIKEDRRSWLESKLKNQDTGLFSKASKTQQPAAPGSRGPPSNPIAGMGNGVTAKLLSKPPARQTYQSRRSKTENGAITPKKETPANANKSRGVLLCGDVVPIRKMNGATGSASLWVKEKSGNLIWVLEEIAEDVALLTVDAIGSVIRGSGDLEAIFGLERVRNGMDVQRLIPAFPKLAGTNTGAIDYDAVAELQRFTARTMSSISIPITVKRQPEEDVFRISSFPHIAGIMVVNPGTLRISSSNNVFSSALFGYAHPEGMAIPELIPGFDKILNVMTNEDKIALVDGIVIPEHSFRRARSLLALREGSADAAAIFLRPSGLPARHRDGAEIMIDVQMRVVRSDRDPIYNESVIVQDGDSGLSNSEVVFALWITYSRQMHAANHGVGPITPMVSRPSTPPRQRAPAAAELQGTSSDTLTPDASEVEEKERMQSAKKPLEAKEEEGPSSEEPFEHPSPDMLEAGCKIIERKKIDDFTILEEMGQGAYGQVKLARYKRTAAKKMVIKYVTKRRILVDTWFRDRRLGTVPLEIHVLDYLRREGMQHPNIVEMADFFEDDINYYIEMIPHGLPGMDLFDYIELRVTMEEEECRKIFKQVAAALRHLHVNAKVVHRDIKDENVILDGEGRVKLVDFGSAAYIKSGPFNVFVGTIDYAAPEVLRGGSYRGKEQDVWALGILLYTIVYKENPFYSIDEIMDHDLRVPYIMSEECIDLIRKMLDRDVDRRIGIQDVIDHPWCTATGENEDSSS